MPSLCEVDVLLALARGRHTQHRAAAGWPAMINDTRAVMGRAAFAIAGGLTLVTFNGGFSGIAGLELTLLG